MGVSGSLLVALAPLCVATGYHGWLWVTQAFPVFRIRYILQFWFSFSL